MRLGLIQLSDIHFRDGAFEPGPDAEMAGKIATAVRTELIGCTHILLVLSGDISFAGQEEEYRYASDWLSELYTLIDDGCEAPCWIICAPGNHDLDHSDDRRLRDTLVDDVTKDPSLASVDEVISECVKEQKAFFEFRANLEGEGLLVYDDSLLRIHRIRDEQSTVQVNTLNSAWMSSRNEQQGALVFPILRYAEQLTIPKGYSVSVIHHPLNWFSTENSRELRQELSKCSSVVLFGHEHIPDDTGLVTSGGEQVRFVDGGVLRSPEGKGSSFNLLILDTLAAKLRILTFRAKNGRYEKDANGDWEPVEALAGQESGRFRVKKATRERLEDVGANILHPRHDRVQLRDVFVYPDLLPVDEDISKARNRLKKTISAVRLILSSAYSHVMIHGDESSGKTALLRMLFSEFYGKGKIPLYLSVNPTATRSVARFRTAIERAYQETYEGDDFTAYEQLDSARRVLLLDGVEFDVVDGDVDPEVLDFVRQFAGRVVVAVTDGLAVQKYCTTEARSAAVRRFVALQVQEIGHVKRDEMIKRWILLGRPPTEWNGPELLAMRDELRAVINTTIGTNLVPARPIFLLAILQSNDTATPMAVGSTYGHYYQYLITSALMDGGVRTEELDAVINYLSELAFHEMFLGNGHTITDGQFATWHEGFCSEYGIRWNRSQLLARLVKGNLLTVEATGNVRFKYEYSFYFFVARRLARSLDERAIRERVRDMCLRLHVEEYSNIILFLVHHSNDPFVLETLREVASTLLSEIAKFNLDSAPDNEQLKAINRLPSPLGRQPLDDRDHETVQKEMLEERDVLEGEERQLRKGTAVDSDLRETTLAGLDVFAQASIAAKTVDLLGQVLRNYYGSLSLARKVNLGEGAVELGLRALSAFVEIFGTRDFELVDMVVNARRQYESENVTQGARLAEEELKRWGRDFVFNFLGRVAEVVIGRIATALGWEQLRPVLDKLVEEKGLLAYRMVRMAALLDGPQRLPRKEIDGLLKALDGNPLAFQILRDLVAQRVYRYPTDYTDRQWLVERMNFSMAGQRAADFDQGRRLLAK